MVEDDDHHPKELRSKGSEFKMITKFTIAESCLSRMSLLDGFLSENVVGEKECSACYDRNDDNEVYNIQESTTKIVTERVISHVLAGSEPRG